MKRIYLLSLLSLFLLISTLPAGAQELPAPSPLGKVEQRAGLTDITITYSRPGAKDRKVFGDLVPFGEIWRTGANMATKISFSTDVKINGNQLAAGEYSIFTIPGESEWTVIFNKNVNQAGTNDYKKEEDALRVNVKTEEIPFRETLTFLVDDIRDDQATIELQWEKTSISIPVEFDYKEQAIKNIDAELKKMEGSFANYHRIARYYVDNNMKLKEALDYANKSVSMREEFWNLYTLSLAQAANNMYKEAVATAEKSKAKAEENKAPAYVKNNTQNIEKWKKMK